MIINETKRLETIHEIDTERKHLENCLTTLISSIGDIPIASPKIMPFGWRKSAKGRTVWRILEEIISQNLELRSKELGFTSVSSADSEVGVYDFEFLYPTGKIAYVNIKSSVLNGRRNKDDISKAKGLLEFYKAYPDSNLYVATFVIDFRDDMTIRICKATVVPVSWIPDVYVNPSNNGNLQSADYKNLSLCVPRTNEEFLEILNVEVNRAIEKRKAGLNNE